MSTENSNLPPHIVSNLEAINKAARNHPELFQHASSIIFSQTGKPLVTWWSACATQDDMITLVLTHPEAGWKEQPSYASKGDFDYVAEIDGVNVELQRAKSVQFTYTPAAVDVSKLKTTNEKGKE